MGLEPFRVEQGGHRLDHWVAEQMPRMSRSLVQRWIDEGHVRVNGQRVKKRYLLSRGDLVEVEPPPPPPLELTPEEMPLSVLFEDDTLLVLNKPPGVVVHPGAGNAEGTLVHGLLHHCCRLPGDPARPGLVHRLDKETSGVLVVAKTPFSLAHLMGQFAQRQVQKQYLAVTPKGVGVGRSDAPIGRDPTHRQRMAVRPTGRCAETEWSLLGRSEGLSLLEVTPRTGRTHQIRVHLAAEGAPLLGDRLYGGASWPGLTRHWLHAYRLRITHPEDGRLLVFTAPVPVDLIAPLPTALQGLLAEQFPTVAEA